MLQFLPGNLVLVGFCLWNLATFAEAKDSRPNILLIMVDDMGFSDIGCYGGEVDTPHLDRLAAGGLRFTQFYNTGRCWPTRAALMTGRYPHDVGHAMMFGEQAPPAYQGTSKQRALMISEVLKPLGYRTYHVGKWHLHNRKKGAASAASWPLGRGFDRSYCVKRQDNFFNPKLMLDEHFEFKRPGDEDSEYYITRAFTDRTIHYLDEHQTYHRDEPFFLYLAHTAPHFPLHALPEDVAKFRERYRVGWDVIRQQRLVRMKKSGILNAKLTERDSDAVAWDSLSDKEKDDWSGRMAVHAAMIYRIDVGIGRIVKKLKSMKALDNTLILFLSDNGASAEYILRGDGHDPKAPLGSGETYRCLEVGWANAANTPFRYHKIWVHEGGISTPLIASWPAGIKNKGGLTSALGHVVDVLPTAVELAGGKVGKEVSGRSLLPVLRGQGEMNAERMVFWEHQGNRAVRQGDWKLVAVDGAPWELYNIGEDRSETKNLIDVETARAEGLKESWQKWAQAQGVLPWDDLKKWRPNYSKDYKMK